MMGKGFSKKVPVLLTLLATFAGVSGSLFAAEVRAVRIAATESGTRVVLDLSAPVKHKAFQLDDPGRVVLDVQHSSLKNKRALPDLDKLGPEGVVKGARSGKLPNNGLRLVFEVQGRVTIQTSSVAPAGEAGHRLILDIDGPATLAAKTVAVTPATPPEPIAIRPAHAPSESGRDIIIAVDAGHGGVDPGASGRRGSREKDIVLAVAKLLAARIDQEPGMKAVLTRDGDYFITLQERTRRARKAKADLFVSIHADSIADSSVSGSSVYVLSERGATSEAARWLAASENAADLKGGVALNDKDPVIQGVLLDLSQSASIASSMSAAENVLKSLHRVGEVRKPRVQQAGFVVLKSPDIPSMLVETAFISNREEERKLGLPAHRQKLANAIYDGIEQYFEGNAPEGTRLASARRELSAGSVTELRK
ncbi:MAG TPA: N-acetylmuramoyl-L-alanine amidase [Steroidobacteraceae bacterium]|nr:N-acetylmuramoyl-L-alanine amidase [Steroidobacteraceae bacterium]